MNVKGLSSPLKKLMRGSPLPLGLVVVGTLLLSGCDLSLDQKYTGQMQVQFKKTPERLVVKGTPLRFEWSLDDAPKDMGLPQSFDVQVYEEKVAKASP